MTVRTYTVLVDPSAQRDLKKLDQPVLKRVLTVIESLATHPRPNGVRKMEGSYDSYRLRVGDHRIIYQIEDRKLIVLIVRVRHRKDVYR